MKPDYLFISASVAALCVAACLAFTAFYHNQRHRWLAVLFWTIFGAGLLVQGFAPHLKIERNAFVIPPSLIAEGKQIHPAEIVMRERRMQWLSAILTIAGSLGLAFYYRHSFVRPRSS